MKRVYFEAYTDAGTVSDSVIVEDNISYLELMMRIEANVVNDVCIIKEEPSDKAGR